MKKPSSSFYAGVFLISAAVMMLQIFQSRLLSVISWYHLSFLIISLAMFGLTLGALKVYRSDEKVMRDNFREVARKHSVLFSLFIAVTLLYQLYMPIYSYDLLLTIGTLITSSIITSLAYYHAGIVIALCLTRSPYPLGITYGVDLLGAGLGCILALVAMETIDTPSALMILAAITGLSSMLFSMSPGSTNKKWSISPVKYTVLASGLVLSIGVINSLMDRPLVHPVWVKDRIFSTDFIAYEKWNSISRVTVSTENKGVKPYLWGASPITPDDFEVDYELLLIDGDAGSVRTRFDGDFSKHKYLEYDVTNLAYNLPELKRSAIIGIGGGRDALSAKYFGVDEVIGLDVNPVQIDLLTNQPVHSEYTGFKHLNGVTFYNNEARSWFRSVDEQFDLIQMSLIDTWAATGNGAFALSENSLYTVEAWAIFLQDLSENGVFTVSRWSAEDMDDTGRLLSISVAALLEMGVENPKDHIYLAHSGKIANMMISKSKFTAEQLKALNDTVTAKQYRISMSPDKEQKNELFKKLLAAKSIDELNEIASTQEFDISPSRDLKPFFFNQARLTDPIGIIKNSFFNKDYFLSHGHARASFNLLLIIGLSLLAVIAVILLPLARRVKNKSNPSMIAGTWYFLMIGLGFMSIEITLLQALGLFLGHPIYGLAVVLFSLILSAGIGSLISEKIVLKTARSQIIWISLILAYAFAVANNLGTVFTDFAEVDMLDRILISIGLVVPGGILLGFGFPTGMRLVEKFDKSATPWFWGINGAAGVLAGSIGLALNIMFGIDTTLMVGGACYGLLIISIVAFAIINRRSNGVE